MKRDGALESLWQKTVDVYHPQNTSIPSSADILIVGGGITGVTTALMLQKQGKNCVIAELHNICFGTTGGTTAHINSFFDTSYNDVVSGFGKDAARTLAKAARDSINLFKQNVTDLKIDCGFEMKDGYVFAVEQNQVDQLDKMYDASVEIGVEVEYVDDLPVPSSFIKAIRYKNQAQIHPARYVMALAREFESRGGIIIENCKVEDVQENNGRLEVTTSTGKTAAGAVIYATHIPPGINLLHFRNAPYRSYALAVQLSEEKYPDGLAYDLYEPYHYYRTQEIDGKRYLIVGGEDHKTGHQENTEVCFKNLEAHARRHFKIENIASRWSSQYFESSDGLAYIGHLPGNPAGVYVATGYGGNGITYSHIAAITLTDMILKGKSEFEELFKPSRVKPVAGFANFVTENADVVAEFIGKRLKIQSLDGLSDLANNEARVVNYEGKKMAAYKNENGEMHVLNPVCTHAKCIVAWNASEKSWDCPCHGARYDVDGAVLTGPARQGLEKIELGE